MGQQHIPLPTCPLLEDIATPGNDGLHPIAALLEGVNQESKNTTILSRCRSEQYQFGLSCLGVNRRCNSGEQQYTHEHCHASQPPQLVSGHHQTHVYSFGVVAHASWSIYTAAWCVC